MAERKKPAREQRRQAAAEDELKPLFPLGQIVGTPGALRALAKAEQHPLDLIIRHVTGDWGQLPKEDIEENERSVKEGFRIFSSYRLNTGAKVWVITEHDRTITTILRPEDY